MLATALFELVGEELGLLARFTLFAQPTSQLLALMLQLLMPGVIWFGQRINKAGRVDWGAVLGHRTARSFSLFD